MNRLLGYALVAFLAPQLLFGQPSDGPRTGDITGWHVVRPGDTLQKITEEYLGTPHLWTENFRLNPDVKNAHLLRIGQRLRVILHRELPPRTAQLTRVHNQVEELPVPNPWQPAQIGDLLKEEDGVRTLGNGSAELEFDDGVRVTLNENSLVYLRRIDQTLRTGKRESIEIVHGQADLAAVAQNRSDLSEIEIVMGDAVNRPRPDDLGRAETRARLEDSGAALMVYSGTGELTSGDQVIEVPAGLGTRVSEDGSVAAPTELLAAPSQQNPASGSVLPYANPEFHWDSVADADHYLLEICADSDCGTIMTVAESDQTTTELQVPTGTWHWRVRAIDSNGLDGFATSTRSLEITDARPDRVAPAIAVVAGGANESADTLRVVSGESFTLSAIDDVSGLQNIHYRWNESEWRSISPQAVAVTEIKPPGLGQHRLEIEAQDIRGRSSHTEVTVSVVAERPSPPVFISDS